MSKRLGVGFKELQREWLFSEVAFEIGIEHNLLGKRMHIDTSSLSVYGDYEEEEDIFSSLEASPTVSPAVPRYGFSKDHRPDLKQMVINLATTGSSGFPIWMESHSGNASDKKILYDAAKRMRLFCQSLKEAPSFMVVGDSAIYDSCVKDAGDMKWLTRVPEQHKVVKELLKNSDDSFSWTELSNDYKMCLVETKYKGVHQRWAVIFSQHAYDREIKTFEKQIQKIEDSAVKSFWHIGNQVFRCEKDASRALRVFEKSLKYHTVSATITPIMTHKGRGRPAQGAVPEITGYQIKGDISRDEQKIGSASNTKGRFVLATNELDRSVLADSDILGEYKEQSKTEGGFRFIKDDTFEVSSIFLKKPSRISALMMVMTLCLMVYAVAQFEFRRALEANNDTIPNQIKKETDKPSMKWVYRILSGIQVIRILTKDLTQEIVINLNDLRKKIIRYFGAKAMQIYGLT